MISDAELNADVDYNRNKRYSCMFSTEKSYREGETIEKPSCLCASAT